MISYSKMLETLQYYKFFKCTTTSAAAKAISFYSSLSLCTTDSSLSLQDGFRVVFMASRESCPINCAKVYFLSNYYTRCLSAFYHDHLTFNKLRDICVFFWPKNASGQTDVLLMYVCDMPCKQDCGQKKIYPKCWKFTPVKEKKTL